MKTPAPTFSLRLLSSAPRAHLFTNPHLNLNIRRISTSPLLRSDSKPNRSLPSAFGGGFGGGPSPPRLPKEEQEIFESLQRASTGAFSTPRTPQPRINQSPDLSAGEVPDAQANVEARVERVRSSHSEGPAAVAEDNPGSKLKEGEEYGRPIDARGEGDELHPNVVRGAQPEFEGERNPRTGEIGGPKNEPLRWGPEGEWSYNGRTTDF